jgi:hypothetical protein
VALGLAPVPSAAQQVFFTDFDSGVPGQFSGVTTTAAVQGYAGLGPAGNQFAGNLLHNATTGNPAAATVLTLTGLAPHTGVSVGFLLAVIDSWDSTNGSIAPDFINVEVDGASVFQTTFNNQTGSVSYSPPAGGEIGVQAHRGFNAEFGDRAYNMYLEPALQNIAHTSSTLTIRWFASGAGWQGGMDESFGLDRVSVSLVGGGTAVPEPGALSLLLAGTVPALLWARRRR